MNKDETDDKYSDDIEREIRQLIDRDNGYTVPEFADKLGVDESDVQSALETLMERGKITSTPDWEYRRSRRSVDTETGR